jgi:hypothetical protein
LSRHCRFELDRQQDNRYLLDMSNATSPAATVTALDADGEEFTLDFADMTLSAGPTARPAKPAAEITADDAKVARKGRSAEFRASWHEEHGTAAKARG